MVQLFWLKALFIWHLPALTVFDINESNVKAYPLKKISN